MSYNQVLGSAVVYLMSLRGPNEAVSTSAQCNYNQDCGIHWSTRESFARRYTRKQTQLQKLLRSLTGLRSGTVENRPTSPNSAYLLIPLPLSFYTPLLPLHPLPSPPKRNWPTAHFCASRDLTKRVRNTIKRPSAWKLLWSSQETITISYYFCVSWSLCCIPRSEISAGTMRVLVVLCVLLVALVAAKVKKQKSHITRKAGFITKRQCSILQIFQNIFSKLPQHVE